MDNKLDLIIASLKKIEDKIEDIPAMKQAIFETLDETKRLSVVLEKLAEGQERQDKILEALAVRSLEQETDIKDLKRIQ